jgi:DNA modification methylase
MPDWLVEPKSMYEPGWYLLSDIIWHKPNPMPESVTDRPTKAHEMLFLLSKRPIYYYDAEAIKETALNEGRVVKQYQPDAKNGQSENPTYRGFLSHDTVIAGRNKRDVWTIPTVPYPGAHFAVFPEALVEPCILAGSAPGDVVLDPFAGSGTAGRVALRHGRSFVGVDISREYLDEQALARVDPLAARKRDTLKSGMGQAVML